MVELLAPAGGPEALDAAISCGADAVYLGLKSFNARGRAQNFSFSQCQAATEALHKRGKKIYITVNTVFCEDESERIYRFLEWLSLVAPDALIVQDYGVIRMCKRFFPHLALHASTQMNASSAKACNLLGKAGVRRVVLARELGLKEVQDIRAASRVELEVFVHGALCVSESGLCLASSFLGGKSANRGLCTQACRRIYTPEGDGAGNSGYYFSPLDLQLIDKLPSLIDAGVSSFKIEGRMKSAEYCAAVVGAYRYLIDNYKKDFNGSLTTAKRMLCVDFARKKTSYFFGFSDPTSGIKGAGSAILDPSQGAGTGLYLGKVSCVRAASDEVKALFIKKWDEKGEKPPYSIKLATIEGEGYDLAVGDTIRLHKKDDTGRESHKVRYPYRDERGRLWIDIPESFNLGDEVYLLQSKSLSRRYPKVLPKSLAAYKTQPRDSVLPIMDLTRVGRSEIEYFPEGLYIEVSTIEDAIVASRQAPKRLVMELNFQSKKSLIEDDTHLPFSKKNIIVALDPYCPEGSYAGLKETIEDLCALGYKTFIANNLSHIGMLRELGCNIIAGPYLYTFNRWAVSFLENLGVDTLITPIENSKANLEATFEKPIRSRVMVSVFSYPVLFRMRFMLPDEYNFTYFSDKTGSSFKVNSTPDGSFVVSEKPFSIVDRAAYLRKEGFTRLLIDYSKTRAKKQDLRVITRALEDSKVLPDTSRFNWREGFYDCPERRKRSCTR